MKKLDFKSNLGKNGGVSYEFDIEVFLNGIMW
jgi:hypothetical protein